MRRLAALAASDSDRCSGGAAVEGDLGGGNARDEGDQLGDRHRLGAGADLVGFPEVDVDEEGYVKVEEPSTKTNLEGVFAVGDVRLDSMKRVASAVGEGAMAVHLLHRYLATT